MTNTIAIFLGGIIITIFAADFYFFDWSYSISLGARFADFLLYIAFWR